MKSLSWVGPLFLLVASGCADLPDLNVCGNGLVDPNEDCDGTDGSDGQGNTVTCGAPNEQRACRFTCDTSDPAHPPVCPVGYACSLIDGICRAPSGGFTQVTSMARHPARLALADFDGDGQSDLFAGHSLEEDDGDRVFFFGNAGATATEIALPALDFATVAPLTRPTNADLIAFLPGDKSNFGMLALEGAGRAFTSASFSSFPVDAGTIILPYYSAGASKLLALKGTELLGFAVNYANPTLYATLVEAPTLDYGRVGLFASGVAVAFGYPHRVEIVFPEDESEPKNLLPATARIQLPSDAGHVKDFWVQDIDGDGAYDVAITNACDDQTSCTETVFIAYGVPVLGFFGEAAFTTASDSTARQTLDAEAVPALPDESGRVIGILDVDNDHLPDLVTEQGVFRGRCETAVCPVPPVLHHFELAASFDEPKPDSAVFVDVNDDGQPDIVAGSSTAPGIQFVLTVGSGLFNKTTITTSGPTSNFVVGDFDGDLFGDVAFSEKLSEDASQIDFLFGGVVARPTGPVVRGPLETVTQLVGNPNILASDKTERSDLLAVTGNGNQSTIALFPGSADREFFSPYFFVAKAGSASVFAAPFGAAVGNFDATSAGADIACIAALPGGEATFLWLLASQTSGTIASRGAPVPTPVGMFGAETAIRTIPGRNGANDRLALLGPTADFKASALSIGDPSKEGPSMFSTPVSFEGTVPISMNGVVVPLDTPSDGKGGAFSAIDVPACIADLDGDGALDIAIVVLDQNQKGQIFVAWGGQDGSFAKPANVGPIAGDDADPAWLTCVHARPTVARQLAVVTTKDLRVLGCDEQKYCTYGAPIVTLSQDVVAYGNGTTSTSAGTLAYIDTIAAGDLTGDGIDDLVVGGYSASGPTTLVLSATPTVP